MAIDNIGQTLQQARNRAGLSVSTMAEQLLLSVEMLEALESNQFDTLAAPAYVKGYIRAYAQQVGLQVEPLIRAFQALEDASDPALGSTSNHPSQMSAKDPFFVWLSIGIIVTLMLFFMMWFFDVFKNTWRDTAPESMYSERQKSETLPEVEVEFVPEKVTVANTLNNNVSQTSPETAVKTESVIETVKQIEADAPVVQESTALQSEVADKDNASDNIKVVEGGIAPEGADQLTLIASGESWVNVVDAKGYRLFYDMLISADGKQVLSGTAPFRIVLGNAPVVTVDVNSESFDIARYIRANNSAYFTTKLE